MKNDAKKIYLYIFINERINNATQDVIAIIAHSQRITISKYNTNFRN